jgi:hypothetical protein
MAHFAIYERCEIKAGNISVEAAAKLLKSALSKYYDEDDITISAKGLVVKGNLIASFERAITKATVHLSIEDRILSYRVDGKASLGFWAWVWFLLGFCTGFFFIWFLWDLVEYIISRDRPKRYFEEAFKALAFNVGTPSRSSKQSETRSTGRERPSVPLLAPTLIIKEVFILREGNKFGPYSIDQLRGYIASGNVHLEDLAWYEGAPTWIPVSQVPGFR